MVENYYLRFPHKGASYHRVRASSLGAAKRKFIKGTTYRIKDVKVKK